MTLKIKVKDTRFGICPRPWIKLEGKIQNDSKVIVFTRNHTDDADDNGTKNIVTPSQGEAQMQGFNQILILSITSK